MTLPRLLRARVILQARQLDHGSRTQLAAALLRLLGPVEGQLIMAGGGDRAVHLAAADPFPRSRPVLVGRSCHKADEVARALDEVCDYVTVSPVYPTAAEPGDCPPLGASGLAVHCPPGLPFFALEA